MERNFFDAHLCDDKPILAVALHDGHALRVEAMALVGLNDEERLREEDPFTGQWAKIVDNHIIVNTSRFEVDLNRERSHAVYVTPKDAWGLEVWKKCPNEAFIQASLEKYDIFYKKVFEICTNLQKCYGRFVVLDIHSYNHRRGGKVSQPADPLMNPEINVGTGTMLDRGRWAHLIDQVVEGLSQFNYYGRHLDVRENVKFHGRAFAQFIHEHFPESACVLSIEIKKIFMDEWSGRPDQECIHILGEALKSTTPIILRELHK